MKLELRRVTLATPGARDARRSWAERPSLLVRLTDSAGHSGLGEASPLPGYGPDTLPAAEAALQALTPKTLESALAQAPVLAALGALSGLLPSAAPSARMALETAALDLLARRAGCSAAALLGAAPDAARPLAQLLGPASEPDLLERAQAALSAGFRTLKLKLGEAGALERELACALTLRERLGRDVRLRLDANGVLSESDVERSWRALEGADIELFEEPGALPASLAKRLPLALDESLQGASEREVDGLLERHQPRCLVLKPMALGGLQHCFRLAELARTRSVAVVISHCFDGVLAWRAAAALALALPADLAHGLGPHAGVMSLAGSAQEPPPWQGGALHTWREPGLAAPEGIWQK